MLQRLRRELRLSDCLLRHRRRSLLDRALSASSPSSADEQQSRRSRSAARARSGIAVAIPAAIVARPKPSAKTGRPRRRAPRPMPIASDRDLLLELERGELELEPHERAGALGDLLRPRTPRPGLRLSLLGVHGPSSRSPWRARPRRRARHRRSAAERGPCRPCASCSSVRFAECGPTLRLGGRLAPGWSAPALGTRLDQARLELAQERGVVGQLLREPSPTPRLRRRPCRRSPGGGPRPAPRPDRLCRHFFAGGASPVATRQMLRRGSTGGHRRDRGEPGVESRSRSACAASRSRYPKLT